MNLHGKTAVVAGGATGLGAACVRRFVKAGASVAILDLNSARGHALAKEVGDMAYFVKADVGTESDVHNAFNEIATISGKLHIAVNTAGIEQGEPVLTDGQPTPLSHFERVVRVNLVGAFSVVRMAAALMVKNEPDENGERGVIISAGSVAAFDGQSGQAAYAASKAGVAGMTLPLAREFAPYGVRVVTVALGHFTSPLTEAMPEADRSAIGAEVPFPQRLGKPSEFAHLTQSIVENPMLNGEVIRLDGALRT